MTGSLAFRKNEAAILRGDVPDKYLRLIPHIPGQNILELGSAEGVLALLLARMGRTVTAIEKSEERHSSALSLYSEWLAREGKFSAPKFVNGAIGQNLTLLEGVDTVVAVRMIYYLRYELSRVFDAISHYRVPNVVLCGNRNRADRFRSGVKDEAGGPHNFYASLEGMKDLLIRYGYTIASEVTDGDEIVVGRKSDL